MWPRVVLLQLAALTVATALPAADHIPDVNSAVLVREKRGPGRSFTFSGFMPGNGMSAFASSADYSPYHARRPGSQPGGWSPHSEYPPEPAPAERPPERGEDKPWAPPVETDEREGGEEEEEAPVTRPPKKNRKKYRPQQAEDEDEYERPSRGGGGGNARASFNAWFPIMFQGYPMHGQGQGVDGYRGAQGARDRDPPGHTTVIANSVSHGRSGVASSHAVAYSGGQGSPNSPQNH